MIYYEVVHQVVVLASNCHPPIISYCLELVNSLNSLFAWGLLLVPNLIIFSTLGACSSMTGPNLFQVLATPWSSRSSVDHWPALQLLTFNVICFISLIAPYILWQSTVGKKLMPLRTSCQSSWLSLKPGF